MHPRTSRSAANLVPQFRGAAALGFLLLFLLCFVSAGSRSQAAGNPIRVNLGSFTGDEQLAQAVAETLLTDLAKSGRITVLDARAGKDSDDGAYILTGSCLVYDGSVVINVRLIDGATGRTVPGAAENADGQKAQLFTLIHSLASKLTTRLAGEVGPGALGGTTVHKAGAGRATPPSIKSVLGLPLPKVSASVNLGGGGSGASPPRSKPRPAAQESAPASRTEENELRSDRDDVGDERDPAMAESQSDTRNNRSDRADRGVQSSNRNGGGSSDRDERPAARTEESVRDRAVRYTSLIIDARGLGLDRSMSPQLRRHDGAIVWNGGEANPDYVISDGIVAYASTMREARDQARAGSRPLIIEAVSRYETPFPADPIIDDEDADYIVKAAARDGFLKKYRVIFVIGR